MIRNNKKQAVLAIGVGMAALALGTTAHAQSSDALIDKLVEKGILNVKEANELRADTDKNFNSAYAVKSGMSDWVNALKFNGDFRGRYDGLYQDNANYGPLAPPAANGYASQSRDRFRYRLRFGVTASMTDNLEVGLRLGSGDVSANGASLLGNAFSANTTLNNDAGRKFLFVDLAYAKWTPKDWFQIDIGKVNSSFWLTDMILDPDYNPEGALERFTYEFNDKHKVNFTSGQFVIAEDFSAPGTAGNNDAYLFVNQLEWTAKWTPRITSHVAAGMYAFANQYAVPATLETFINQNGTPASGIGAHSFNPFFLRGELTYGLESFPFFTGEFPISIGVEYANNPGANGDAFPGKTYRGSANEAYNLGVQLGSAKAKGNWQIAYNYKNIETASLWHGLNDDDFGFNGKGGTDSRGHQIKASYHAWDALTLGFSYYNVEQINNPAGVQAKQQRIFLDVLLTF